MSAQPLHIQVICSQPFAENTYLLWLEGDERCVIIDPGLEPRQIIDFCRARALTPAAVLATHGHCDHIGGTAAMKQQWPDCPLVIGAAEADKLTDPDLNLSATFGLPLICPPADVTVEDGDRYEAAGIGFRVLEIPGHSSGHVVFAVEDRKPVAAFVGDVIFAGSVGRTDFPDGDFDQLRRGIFEKLFTLPDATELYPGHGPKTTVGVEKVTNPFVGENA